MGCLENWQILKLSTLILYSFYRIMYNCVGRAIGEIMFTCSSTVKCAFMLHLLGLICW